MKNRFSHHSLHTQLGSIKLENPLIVGAGWDKSGTKVGELYKNGFAAVEVGTVTPFPQPGNPEPREFLLKKGVVINRCGFNSLGMEVVAKNLEKYKDSDVPIGISIGKNKDLEAVESYSLVTKQLYPYASYFAVNVSSPNTPGLRYLQEKKPLLEIIKAILGVMDSQGSRKDVFIKIAPDLTNHAIDDIVQIVVDNKLTGIIASNTTTNSEIKAKYGERWRNESGGLSGNDLDYQNMTTAHITYIYKATKGKIEIIGVGGINSSKSALEKIQAGAKALQIVTAIKEYGPIIANKINRELVKWMRKNGVSNISTITGTNSKIYIE